jgi:hypothetical protein
MTRAAVAYIRRSSGQDSPASLEQQESVIALQAERRGEMVTEVFKDWGRSIRIIMFLKFSFFLL